MRIPRASALVLCLAAPIVSCGDDEATGPEADQITGIWNATQMEYTCKSFPAQVDLVDLGGSATLTLDEAGTFELIVVEPGEGPDTISGTWQLSADTITITEFGMPFSIVFDVTLSGNSLVMRGGDVEFDFDGDEVEEEADLDLTFVR
jgi:hypothetical protein